MNHYDQEKCSLVKIYPAFGETYYLVVKIYVVGSRFFYIVGARLADKTTSNPSRQ
jgi:hypothetical protein